MLVIWKAYPTEILKLSRDRYYWFQNYFIHLKQNIWLMFVDSTPSLRYQDASVSDLGAIENQKPLNIDLTKPTLAQQFPTTVNGEPGHDHYSDILSTGTRDFHKA